MRADRRLQRFDHGRIVLGGFPLKIVKLTASGRDELNAVIAGRPVGDDAATARLVHKLLGLGMLHPVPAPVTSTETASSTRSITVIIPVWADQIGLDHTLAALAEFPGRIIVVDDASPVPITLPSPTFTADSSTGDSASSKEHPEPIEGAGDSTASTTGRSPWPSNTNSPLPRPAVELVRSEHNEGPAAARNRGLAHRRSYPATAPEKSSTMAATELVLFVDAGVIITPDDVARLAQQFNDRSILAAAPRVRTPAVANPSARQRYEAEESPLDMGPDPAVVRPGSPVGYVPSTCLMIRPSVLADIGPFDPELRAGEDVDFIWRLADTGLIRYVPDIVVTHPERASIVGFMTQRFHYGTAAGPLSRRHRDASRPLRCSPPMAITLGSALLGWWPVVAVAGGYSAWRARRELAALPDPGARAVVLTAQSVHWSAQHSARAIGRTWWPLLIIGCVSTRTRRLALRAAAIYLADRCLRAKTKTPHAVAYGVLDDLSYGAGVWRGVAASRGWRALIPAISSRRDQAS